jgi:2-oxo-4-hydroxy-4-carboxy-5-ureidoimidazoline decarboxylase
LISPENFCGRFEHLFEHSPWVVERAAAAAPFDSTAALHKRLMQVVAEASAAEQLALIRAHPELAACSVPLTEASNAEQTGAGLKSLTQDEFKKFSALNQAYRQKFGFPFIICVRQHSKAEIFVAFEQRLHHSMATEHAQALTEIGEIARLRLQDLTEHTS